MITHKNVLTVPEVSCYSREEIEGGVIIRYMVRNPGEVEWRSVKVFRAIEQDSMPREGHRGTSHEARNEV